MHRLARVLDKTVPVIVGLALVIVLLAIVMEVILWFWLNGMGGSLHS